MRDRDANGTLSDATILLDGANAGAEEHVRRWHDTSEEKGGIVGLEHDDLAALDVFDPMPVPVAPLLMTRMNLFLGCN